MSAPKCEPDYDATPREVVSVGHPGRAADITTTYWPCRHCGQETSPTLIGGYCPVLADEEKRMVEEANR